MFGFVIITNGILKRALVILLFVAKWKENSQVSDFVLELKGITKIFPGVKALDNVEFRLREGQIHAIMGENGAGKSTFIKIITGVLIQKKEKYILTVLR